MKPEENPKLTALINAAEEYIKSIEEFPTNSSAHLEIDHKTKKVRCIADCILPNTLFISVVTVNKDEEYNV